MSKAMGAMAGSGELLKATLEKKMAEKMASPKKQFTDITSGKNFDAMTLEANSMLSKLNPKNMPANFNSAMNNFGDKFNEYKERLNPVNFRETGDKMYQEMVEGDDKRNAMQKMITDLDNLKFQNTNSQIQQSLKNRPPINLDKLAGQDTINNSVKQSIGNLNQFTTTESDIVFPSYNEMSSEAKLQRKKRVEDYMRNFGR
jgi:hypothetical protein